MTKSGKQRSTVTHDSGHITLHDDNGSCYDIAIDRVSSEKDILSWVLHLGEKNWVSKSMIVKFIEIGMRINGMSRGRV